MSMRQFVDGCLFVRGEVHMVGATVALGSFRCNRMTVTSRCRPTTTSPRVRVTHLAQRRVVDHHGQRARIDQRPGSKLLDIVRSLVKVLGTGSDVDRPSTADRAAPASAGPDPRLLRHGCTVKMRPARATRRPSMSLGDIPSSESLAVLDDSDGDLRSRREPLPSYVASNRTGSTSPALARTRVNPPVFWSSMSTPRSPMTDDRPVT